MPHVGGHVQQVSIAGKPVPTGSVYVCAHAHVSVMVGREDFSEEGASKLNLKK